MLRDMAITSGELQREDCTLSFEWVEAGAAGTGDLVLMHGFGMDRTAMRPLARALLERGVGARALLPDARGHGSTRTPARDDAFSYPALRDDCIALLESQAPEGAHLVGHSMGGQVALMAAIARPDLVRSLSLVAAGPCRAVTHPKEQRSWERAAGAFESAGPEALAAALASAAPTRDPELSPARLYGAARGADLARVVRGGFLAVESNDEACAALRTPALLIAGSADAGWLEPTRKLAGLLSASELHLEDGAGHVVHLERTAACADRIARFVNGLR